MALIDRFIPAPAMRQVDRVPVAAAPERAWDVARTIDVYRLPLARALFELRTLPERLFARRRGGPRKPAPRARIDDMAGPQSGFQILAEAGLSFLGLGVKPPTPSLGSMLNGATIYLYKRPELIVYPGALITLIALVVSVIGNALRDALDPRLSA